jgi:hypothetical protein
VAGDLLTTAGLLGGPDRGAREADCPDHTVCLHGHEAEGLAAATGVPVPRLHAMTLRVFDGHAVALDTGRRRVRRGMIWGRGAGSRYCPRCLAGRGGRWVLRWRLSWAFACTRCRILLADRCPGCGQVPRPRGRAPFAARPPGTCGAATGRGAYCQFDLTTAPAATLPAGHPLLAAQARVEDLLDRVEAGRTAGEGAPRTAFGDLHVLASWLLRRAEGGDVAALGGADLAQAWHAAGEAGLLGAHAGTFPPVDAALTGTALTCADALLTGEVDTALATLQTLCGREPAAHGLTPVSPGRLWEHTSPRLRQLVWRARDPDLTHVDTRLRYRTCTPTPRAPAADVADRARHVPQLLWPGWTVRLLPPGFATDTFRAALAAALLLPGNPGRRTGDAAELLQPGRRLGVSRVLRRLATEGHEGVLRALCALADHLDTHGAPIDYARRCALVAPDLLPAQTWHDMCRHAGAHPGGPRRLRDVRRHLYQRITGNDLRHAPHPFTLARSDERAAYLHLPLELPTPLRRALDDYAAAYLADAGIDAEPLTWEPPAGCLGDLDLPGTDPDDLDIELLHRLLREDGLPPGEAATRLGTSIEHIRLALEHTPLPPQPRPPRNRPTGADERERQARRVLTPAFLGAARAARKSVSTIARETGSSTKLVRQLLHDAGLPPLRPTGRRPTHHLDPTWLREQYLTRRRTLPDIAAELGIPLTSLNRHAAKLGIPFRPPGPASHATALAQPDPALPRIIRQALTGAGAWDRLHRFQAAMRHPTLHQAADTLGMRPSALGEQIIRLEHDIGARLHTRAVPGRPMRPTPEGRTLLTALEAVGMPDAG